jgi:hypothetical protein
MKKLSLVLIVFIVCFYSCKKSCVTCNSSGGYDKYDSIVSISYDSILHKYDSLLVKVDTLQVSTGLGILHFCPSSPAYNGIVTGSNTPLEYYDPANYQTYYCSYDQ